MYFNKVTLEVKLLPSYTFQYIKRDTFNFAKYTTKVLCNMNPIIKQIEQIVEQACKKEENSFGYGSWSHHIIYVVKFSKMLAKKLHADPEVVEIAALLHDYAGIKDKKFYKEHHIHGAIEAEKILKKFNYPTEKIEQIKHCILSHRGSTPTKNKSPEAEAIASADAMAHIDQVVSLLFFMYNKKKLGIEEGKGWVKNKLERSWNKLCPEAREIIQEKYHAAQKILE